VIEFIYLTLWVTGLEQLLGPIVIVALFFLRICSGKVILPTEARVFFVFIVYVSLHALTVTSVVDALSVLRDSLNYLAGLCVYLLLVNSNISQQDVAKRFIRFVVIISLLSCFYVLGYEGHHTFAKFILPDFILQTDNGNLMTFRTFGRELDFMQVTNTRLKGISTSAIQFSFVLLTAWMIVMVYERTKRKSLFTLFFLVVLFFTQSRISMLVASVFYFILTFKIYRQWLVVVFCLLIITTLYWSDIVDLFEHVFIHTRSGSFQNRYSIYIHTIDDFLNAPLWGYSVQKMSIFADYPLGSHSFYLGVLYKYGMVGFTMLLIFLLLITKSLRTRAVEVKLAWVGLLSVLMIMEPVVDVLTTLSWFIFVYLIKPTTNLEVKN